MKPRQQFAATLALAAACGLAFAQTGANTGTTAGGASTNPGAGVVTSGTAAPQAQTPRAPDSTLGTRNAGTGAGMGASTAGKAENDPKKASAKSSRHAKARHAKSKSRKKSHSTT